MTILAVRHNEITETFPFQIRKRWCAPLGACISSAADWVPCFRLVLLPAANKHEPKWSTQLRLYICQRWLTGQSSKVGRQKSIYSCGRSHAATKQPRNHQRKRSFLFYFRQVDLKICPETPACKLVRCESVYADFYCGKNLIDFAV